jgi:WD40 repeat protein
VIFIKNFVTLIELIITPTFETFNFIKFLVKLILMKTLSNNIIGLVLKNYSLNKTLKYLNEARSKAFFHIIKQREYCEAISFIGGDSVGNIFIIKQNTYYPESFKDQVKYKITSMILIESFLLATGHDDGSLSLWDTENLELIQNSKIHKNDITCIIKLDEHIIATSSWDKTLKLIDLTNDSITTLSGHDRFINHIAKINLQTIASASCDTFIKIWKYDTCIKTLSQHSDSVNILLVLSTYLISGSDDKTIKIYNIVDDYCLLYSIQTTETVKAFVGLGVGLFASGGSEGVINIYDVKNGCIVKKLVGHESEISYLACYENELSSGDVKGFVKTWSLVTHTNRNTFRAHESAVIGICYQGYNDILTCTWDRNIKKWDLGVTKSLAHASKIKVLLKLGKYILVSGCKDKIIRVWDLHSGKCVKELKGHKKPVECIIKFKKDMLISADKTCYVWDLKTNLLIKSFRNHNFEVSTLLLCKERLVSASSREKKINIWDVEEGNCVKTINENFWNAETLSNNTIVFITKDSDNIFILNINNTDENFQVKGHLCGIRGLLTSKNYLISYNDEEIQVMDKECKLLKHLSSPTQIKSIKHQDHDEIVIIGTDNKIITLNLKSEKFKHILNENSYDILTIFKI